MIVFAVFLSNQMEFRLIKRNCQYDHIPCNVKGIEIVFLRVCGEEDFRLLFNSVIKNVVFLLSNNYPFF